MRHEVPVPAHKSNYSIVSDKAEWSLQARVTATTTVHPGPLRPETTTETILILKCSVLSHARTHTPTCKHNCIFDLTTLNSWWKIFQLFQGFVQYWGDAPQAAPAPVLHLDPPAPVSRPQPQEEQNFATDSTEEIQNE